MKKTLYGLLDRFLTAPLLGVSLCCLCWRLFSIRKALRLAQHIVVMPDGGFGHTLTGPDAMRRLFKGKRLVFIVFERVSHNPFVALLWADVQVVVVAFRWRMVIKGRLHEWFAPTAARQRVGEGLIRWLRRSTSADVMSLMDLYHRVASIRPIRLRTDRFGCGWEGGWVELLDRVPAPALHLPPDVQRTIRARIEQFAQRSRAGKNAKLCCLYLRRKGEGSGDNTTARRVGAPFEAYLPALRLLRDHGFLVLLTGDHVPDRRYIGELDHQLVCAPWINVDPLLFALFAGTEADIWIGNMGGGNVPPIPNRIPMLVVDGFPYGAGVPHAWMHYKTVLDERGRLIHYNRLFAEHALDCDLPGWTVCNNTPEQIANAVHAFLSELSSPAQTGRPVPSLPDYTMERHVHSRFSAPWLRLFEAQHGANGVSEPLLVGARASEGP